MNTGDKVRALSNVHVILVAPFNPFVVSVKVFHFCTASICLGNLLFLVPFCVVAQVTAYRDGAGILWMDQLPMRPFTCPWNFGARATTAFCTATASP
mgnify:CR=1 FL=1